MRGKSFSFGEVLGFGWRTMKDNLSFFVGMLVILFLISSLSQIFGYVIQQYSENLLPFLALLFFPVTLIIEIIVGIGLIKITLSFCDEQKPRISTLFDAWGCFWKYLGAGLFYCLIIMAPPAACILLPMFSPYAMSIPYVPMFFFIMAFILAVALSIKFSLCFYFVVDKGLGPINALRASSRTTMDAKGTLFFFGIVCSLINLLGVLCFVVGIFATFPTVMVAMALVYRQLSTQTPGLSEFGIIGPIIEPNPITHSGLSIRLRPDSAVQTTPCVQSATDIQNAPRVQTAPGIEHALNIQTDTNTQPDTDTQHFMAEQPVAHIQSDSGNQPDSDTHPDADTQSFPCVQPGHSIQHALGNLPGAGLQKAPCVQTIPQKKKSKSLLLVVLLAAALIVTAAAYCHLRPASTKAETSNKDVILTGILYAGDNSSAVIDGTIVHEGDTINGAKVIKIYEDKVELARDGETWTQQVK